MTTLEDAAIVNRPQGDKKPTTRQLHSTSRGCWREPSLPGSRKGAQIVSQAEDEAVDLGVLATVLSAFGFVPCRAGGQGAPGPQRRGRVQLQALGAVVMNDMEHVRDAVFFEGPDVRQRLSRFWILITLASVIAAAGVAADSTATVIGAMIVAPLMTPILGTMLSVVLADRSNLIRSLLLVAGGGLAAIAIGWLVGLVVVIPSSRRNELAGCQSCPSGL